MYYTMKYHSPIGTLTLAGNEGGLAGLWIEGQKYYGGSILNELADGKTQEDQGTASGEAGLILEKAKDWLEQYFNNQRPMPDILPLRPAGSEFQKKVWKILCEIPYGQVVTYGEIAKKMAANMNREHMSAQAVGGAIGHNPISIIIPCHRVVGSKGSMRGYAGGIEKKRMLLEWEGVDVSALVNLHAPGCGRTTNQERGFL